MCLVTLVQPRAETVATRPSSRRGLFRFGGHGGDVEGYYDADPTWPDWMDYYLGGDASAFEVVNLGVSGATAQKSADKPWSDQPEYDEAKKLDFDLAVASRGVGRR